MTESIFHYTKLSTFLEHILPTQNLRFSKFKGSRDPYEYITRRINVLNTSDEELKTKHPEIYEKLQEISRSSENSLFLSFCMPNRIPSTSGFLADTVYYGHDKPRMWDQYGDGNQGVCLGFNKKKLLKSFSEMEKHNMVNTDFSFLNNEVIYKSFKNSFFPNTFVRDISTLLQNDQDGWDMFFKDVDKGFFLKDYDYQDEREYRLIVKTSIDKTPDFYIDIHESLSCIIFGDKVNTKSFQFFEDVIMNTFSKSLLLGRMHWGLPEGYLD